MTQIGAIGFAAPWLLLGLLALPVLWWLLRATPPTPLKERFPGVAVLLGLDPTEKTPDRTPWWLLLLRCVIAGLAILAFAEPLLNPRDRLTGAGPLHLAMDAGWASAPDWRERQEAAAELLDQAAAAGRPVRLEILSAPGEGPTDLLPASEARARIEALEPNPWAPDRAGFLERLAAGPTIEETVWLHDGLDHDGAAGALAQALARAGPLRMIGPERIPRALAPAAPGADGDAALSAVALRAAAGAEESVRAVGFEAGEGVARRALMVAAADFGPEDTRAEARFDAPLELRNRVALLALDGADHAGAVALIDDRWRRRRVGIVSGARDESGRKLLSGAHYVREALRPVAELREGGVSDLLEQAPDVMILIDVGAFPEGEAEALSEWVEAGGALIRFAGPAMAAATEAARAGAPEGPDPLTPVRLRPGGRDLGGAMSWGEEQRLAPFPPESPFHGLDPPEDAAVARQVLAEPDVDLPTKTWASLADGAPLVTAEARGAGRIVLFHTSADPTWSTLPLSGLFVEMLTRAIAFGSGASEGVASVAGRWRPTLLLDAHGGLRPATGAEKSVDGEILANGAGPQAPPGLYEAEAGPEQGARRALNLFAAEDGLTLAPAPPPGAALEVLGQRNETRLRPWLLAAALGLLVLDALAAMALAGKLSTARGAAAAALLAILLGPAGEARAQGAEGDGAADKALRAALDGALGYVLTGDDKTDAVSRAGMRGLSRTLTERTTVEPPEPTPVDLERDALAVYPLIYWGVSPQQESLSDAAVAKLNAYMRDGGMLLIDTRDGNLALGGAETPGTRALRRLAVGLDLPPLAPPSEAHVLRRTFYLLEEFPGRWTSGALWLQAEPPEDIAEAAERGGFRNDGVSPVVIGGRDWAGAWAITDSGRPMLPVPGGERQREMALRFGVNLVMYAYTGSYKSDQVHIPALLQRLGQ